MIKIRISGLRQRLFLQLFVKFLNQVSSGSCSANAVALCKSILQLNLFFMLAGSGIWTYVIVVVRFELFYFFEDIIASDRLRFCHVNCEHLR